MPNPSRHQLQIMHGHRAGPLPFVARGQRQVSIRALVDAGFLVFDRRRLETRLTQSGQDVLRRIDCSQEAAR